VTSSFFVSPASIHSMPKSPVWTSVVAFTHQYQLGALVGVIATFGLGDRLGRQEYHHSRPYPKRSGRLTAILRVQSALVGSSEDTKRPRNRHSFNHVAGVPERMCEASSSWALTCHRGVSQQLVIQARELDQRNARLPPPCVIVAVAAIRLVFQFVIFSIARRPCQRTHGGYC
jgi:hypothetical protein